jgi:hypothetical protein
MNDDLQESFSEDPEEQLRIENEILKLKIQAELGGDFEGEESLPPDVENAFLKNVLEFEHKQANAPVKTLYEILDRPAFVRENELNDERLQSALAAMEELLEAKGIMVDYATDYPLRVKYKFITEELFNKEAPEIHISGMTMHYIYEEFHPNHAMDIEAITEDFFNHWIERSFEENDELAEEMILDDGSMLSKYQLLQKVQLVFDAYTSFENASYTVDNISYELHEGGTGLGYSEGVVQYDAIMENGEVQQYESPYKLYLQYDDVWSIFFFHWPGFIW